jgi:hypothetical protein
MNRLSASNGNTPSVPVPPDHLSPDHPDANEFPPITSFKKLEDLVRNSPPDSPMPSRPKLRSAQKATKKTISDDEPWVVLAADEANTMTIQRFHYPHQWSNFVQFRSAIRSVIHCSLFSLFLSTTGKITQFTSSKDKDHSGRVVAGILFLIAPYTDLGFDQLAKKIVHNGNFTLDDITSDDHIVHYGRPMYVYHNANV